MPRTDATPRENLGVNVSNAQLQLMRTPTIRLTTTSMPTTALGKADNPAVVTATVFCADKARNLPFTPLGPPEIHRGIEYCDDAPAVRNAADPLAKQFRSAYWSMNDNDRPAGVRYIQIFRATPPAILHVADGVSTTIIPLFSAMRVNGVVIDALSALEGAMDQVWHGHVWYGHITTSSAIERIDQSDTAERYVFVGIHQDMRGSK